MSKPSMTASSDVKTSGDFTDKEKHMDDTLVLFDTYDDVKWHEEEQEAMENFDFDERLPCSLCNENFPNYLALVEHQDKHSKGLICPTCGYEGSSKTSMVGHERSHLNRDSVQCLICKERMVGEKQLEQHLRRHLMCLSSCPWCTHVSSHVSELKDHIDNHLKDFRVNCNFCKYVVQGSWRNKCMVEDEGGLYSCRCTIPTWHSELECRICPFNQKHPNPYYAFCPEDLRVHSELHVGSLPNLPHPPRRKTKKPSKVHESLCESQPPLANDQTQKVSVFEELMKQAICKCSICGKLLGTNETLEEHMEGHVKSGIAYCPYCSYRTDDRDQIFQHVISHLKIESSQNGGVISRET